MNKIYLIIFLFLLSNYVSGQSKVAITFDDVPNTKKFEKDDFQAKLLNQLDTLEIPVAVFINEGMVYKTQFVARNFDLLNQWIKRDYSTLGNHTFAHSRYSDVGYEKFTADIEKGEGIPRELATLYKKQLKYFRFTYNDLGKDSLQQRLIETFLKEKEYISAPFTIESSDWIFNYLYEYYLKCNKKQESQRIGNSYINTTLEYFRYFDSLSVKQYGRHINQIYLCHDNSINADYIVLLVKKLKEQGYSFISLDEAMQDDVHTQENNYFKKWGVSWMYRWMTNNVEIKRLMNNEPDILEIYKEYQKIQKQR